MRRFIVLVVFLVALAFPVAVAVSRLSEPATTSVHRLASHLPAGPAGANQYVQAVPTATGPTAVSPAPAAAAPARTLPFTGENLLLVVLTALILGGAGVTLYRQVSDR